MKYISLLSALGLISLATTANAEDLTFTGFGGALQDTVRQTMLNTWDKGSVTEESYNGGIAKIKAMVETNSTNWDVVQMDENEMILACEQGLLEPMDWATFPLADQIMDSVKGECGVGAFFSSMVPAYDGGRLEGISGWADFWDVEKIPGKRGLRKVARATVELALLADGVPLEEIYAVLATPEGQDRAFAKLDKLKPHIQWWESGAQPIEWLASGDVIMSAVYNGRVAAARKEGRDFRIQWNGQLQYVDFWAIPKGAKKELATDLVAHMVSAEPQAAFAKEIYYGPTNTTAKVDPEIEADLPTAPENMKVGLVLNTPFWIDQEEALQQRFNTWVAQ